MFKESLLGHILVNVNWLLIMIEEGLDKSYLAKAKEIIYLFLPYGIIKFRNLPREIIRKIRKRFK
ncbi:MAG: hypothetical protein LBL16_00415 [Endomicrobium sp.]|nr:hypothetical protein [Endomicrobium sp.]